MSNLFLKKHFVTQHSKALLMLTLGLSFLHPHVSAQSTSDDEERWYQIELLIFSQTLGAIDTGESWPKDIALAYPPGTILLSSTEDAVDGEDNIDTNIDQAITESALSEPLLADLPAGDPLNTLIELPDETPVINPIKSKSFIDLPEQELTLKSHKNRLERNNQYRVLKHIAWRQPIAEKTTAKSVVITGGDQFGEHFELEGTISVNASRYLHLETNLWLTQFYPNLGVDESTNLWPDLPKIPTPVDETFNLQSSNNLSFNTNNDNQFNQFGSLNSDTNTASTFSSFTNNDSVLRKPYLIDQIILLSQSRRMRSNELHYVDHPAIGVLAKITPWEPITADKSEF